MGAEGYNKTKVDGATVRDDFNHISTVIHYTKAAHTLGLWESERLLLTRYFPDQTAPLLEAGCGAGRVAIGLWELGYRNLTAFDFASELVDQAQSLALERQALVTFLQADATRLEKAGAQAMLVGESLMRQADVTRATRDLLAL